MPKGGDQIGRAAKTALKARTVGGPNGPQNAKGKSDPRQATPKGSRGQAYPREGSVEKAVGESAGRSYREADMRRGARDEGATQTEVLQLSKRITYIRRSRAEAAGNTPGDPPDAPQGEGGPRGPPTGRRKSAEGVVGAVRRG